MGNPIGRAHVILRLSSFGLSLLPHLNLLGANAAANEHQSISAASSVVSVPPRAEAFAMAAPPVAVLPKAEQSDYQHQQPPHTAPANTAATATRPTLVDTVVQHATSVMRATHASDASEAADPEGDASALGWLDPSQDRPPALFFCREANGGDEPVGAALSVQHTNALAQVRSVLFVVSLLPSPRLLGH